MNTTTRYTLFSSGPITREANLRESMRKNQHHGHWANRNPCRNMPEGLQKLVVIKPYDGDNALIAACKARSLWNRRPARKWKASRVIFTSPRNASTPLKRIREEGQVRHRAMDAYNKTVNDINAASQAFNKTNQALDKQRTDLLNDWNKAVNAFSMSTHRSTDKPGDRSGKECREIPRYFLSCDAMRKFKIPTSIKAYVKPIDQLREKGITDEHVLQAMNNIPRHYFLDSAFDKIAYERQAFPISEKVKRSRNPIPWPYQTQLLQVKPTDKILEIGTGSIYWATVLAEMGSEGVHDRTAKEAVRQNKQFVLKNQYPNIKFFYGDGYEGLPTFAPLIKWSSPRRRFLYHPGSSNNRKPGGKWWYRWMKTITSVHVAHHKRMTTGAWPKKPSIISPSCRCWPGKNGWWITVYSS